MLKNKLILGGAQFGMKYGISNTEGITADNEVLNILNAAKTNGINIIDTAIAYGKSEEVLGQLGVREFELISKIPAVPENVCKVSEWVDKQIFLSLKKMNVSSLNALLLHAPFQLLSSKGVELYKALMELKYKGIVGKIGVSIYSPEELDEIMQRYDIDLVQSPFNILDRRIIESGWAEKLRDKDVELHVRSIFLQGLLLMTRADRPKKFNKWAEVWTMWDSWLEDQSISAVDACCGFVSQQEFINKVVVGFENVKQFNQVVNSNNDHYIKSPLFRSVNDELVIPSKWNEL